jgi:uncharacterized protein YggE
MQGVKMKNKFLYITMAAAMLVVVTSCTSAPSALPVGTDTTRRTITVVGEGTSSAKPDIARASIGVEITATTVADATKQNNDKMNAVVAKLKALGIADKDIQTTNYNVSIQRNTGRTNEIIGYHVTNTVSITIRDLSTVGTIIDQATQAGANNIYGISFAIDNISKLQDDARAKAMADAQKRADDLARLGGATRGDPLSISEVIQSNPVPFAAPAVAALRAADSEPAIETGELSVSMRVQVIYAIK